MAGIVAGLGAGRVLGVDTGAVPDPTSGSRASSPSWARARRGCGCASTRSARATSSSPTPAAGDRRRRPLEGLILDPVYTAKAMAGLAAAVADGDIKPGERTVFVHTGGLPGLFGHPYAAELAQRVAQSS